MQIEKSCMKIKGKAGAPSETAEPLSGFRLHPLRSLDADQIQPDPDHPAGRVRQGQAGG